MENLLFIFSNVIIPIFIIVLLGGILNAFYKLDIKTLTKLQFNLLMPAVFFLKIYDSDLSISVLKQIFMFVFIAMALMYLISFIVANVLGYSKGKISSFVNASTYFNCGNYTIPLMQLLFNSPFAVSIQTIILMIHNTIFFTFGIYTTNSGNKGSKMALEYILKMPLIYVMISGLILRRSGIIIADPVRDSLDMVALAYTGIAFITLGVQLSETKISKLDISIILSNIFRLILSPAVGFGVVILLGIEGMLAQIFVIAMAAPTAINVALSAIEMDNEPEFASQAVFSSTLLSSVTVTFVIWMVFKLIPA